MTTTPRKAAVRDQAINIRVSRSQRDLIDQAAQMLGKSRSDFMLEIACRESENVLLDRVLFRLSDEEYVALETMLDDHAPGLDALRALLSTKAPWE